MLNFENKNIADLIELIRCAIKGEKPQSVFQPDIEQLLLLAEKQQVYNLILPVLKENGMLSDEEDGVWKNYYMSELEKTLIVNNEREKVCADLDAKGVRYMFTKGLIIKDYYPRSMMRQMSDNDFLYDETQWEELFAVMKKHGFYLDCSTDNGDDFVKEPFCRFEFHRKLFNKKDDFCPDFNPLENAVPAENGSRLLMTREDNYLYTLGHMYKHYHCKKGCGIRFVCDLYLLKTTDTDMDFDYIESTLESWGIKDFNETVLNLAFAVFENEKPSEKAQEMLDTIFESGLYGAPEDKDYSKEIKAHGGKLGYLFYRLFPPKSFMKDTYIQLEKKPYLLGYFYIYRLFTKYSRNKKEMKRDLNGIFKNRGK